MIICVFTGACNNGTSAEFISYDLNPCTPLQKPGNTRLLEDGLAATDNNIFHPDNQGLSLKQSCHIYWIRCIFKVIMLVTMLAMNILAFSSYINSVSQLCLSLLRIYQFPHSLDFWSSRNSGPFSHGCVNIELEST